MDIGIDAHILSGKIKAGTYVSTLQLLKNILNIDSQNHYILYLRSLINIDDSKSNHILKKLKCPSSKAYGDDFFLLTFWLLFSLPIELIKNKPDIYYSPTPTLPFVLPCKTVVKVNDVAYLLNKSYFNTQTRLAIGAMTSRAIKRADKIIAISKATKGDLINYFKIKPEKISVIYIGYDSQLYKPCTDLRIISAIKNKYNIREQYLLYVGTLEPRKNIVRLIRAFNNVRNRFETKLVITGAKGWLYNDIFKLVSELGLGKDVIFTGFVPDEDLPILISGALSLVYPSLYEGFGLPLLQGMACGIPVITSRVSSMPEVVGDAGWLIDPYNINELSDAIRTLIENDKLRKDMSEKGLLRAKLFSQIDEAKQTIDVFNSIE